MSVAIGFTGPNGMHLSEKRFDPPGSRFMLLLEELYMAQGMFYKVVRNPMTAFTKSLQCVMSSEDDWS